MEKLLVTPEEAAEMLGVSRSRIFDLTRSRKPMSVQIGHSRRIPLAALRECAERLCSQS